MYELGLNYTCDIFLMSFFHELGHLETLPDKTESEFNRHYKICDTFHSKDKFNKKDFFRYFNSPIEKSASEWAVDYINNNPYKVKEFYDKLLPLLLEGSKKV